MTIAPPLGNAAKIMEKINVDIAASTQKLFEASMLRAAGALHDLATRIGRPTTNLCLTGGAALNCPTNSMLGRDSGFTDVLVTPSVHDGGLSTGAALALTHNVLGIARPERKLDAAENAYLGVPPDDSATESALSRLPQGARIQRGVDSAKRAAEYLADNKIVGWFQGRSEIGPRALGHRSILANPRYAENWNRVNQIKKREHWRPFAPAVLLDRASEWFAGIQLPSPYMLFTAQVLKDDIPAVTHVDGSARVQTVDRANDRFFSLITHFGELTGLPVVLNTSFNGPGEPIVERAEEAVRLFFESELDVLFVGDAEITKA